MNIFDTKIGNNLFQTYFIECTNPNTRLNFMKYLESVGIVINGNPNILNEVYESFTIDNVRLLNQFHNEKSSNNGKKVFIIEALTINHEAHNALLKMFEEPTENTHFFFLIPRVDILPDTLKSRAHLIYEDRSNLQNNNQDANEFINSSKSQRLEKIANLVTKHKNSETSSPLRDEARILLDGCEYFLHNDMKSLDENKAWKFEELLKAKKYLSTSGASVKMILEHIALVI
jgi:DNA polymerase III delta prime subunit